MARQTLSIKKLQLDKSNATTIAVLAVSSMIVVFSIIGVRALLSQRSYQARVIAQKKQTLEQLKANNDALSKLAVSYEAFIDPSENIIGGTKDGTGDRDGDNAKIVLDALPSKYDFPALASSIDKILSGNGFPPSSISGTDDEVNQSTATPSDNKPVAIPFQVSLTNTFDGIQGAISVLQRSIRPIQLLRLELSGSNGTVTAKITAQTYYLPEKNVSIQQKVVK